MKVIYLRSIQPEITVSVAPSNISSNASGLPVMESEVIYAFSALSTRNRKTSGKDNIYTEVFKLITIKKF
jgi:hypothetical protein